MATRSIGPPRRKLDVDRAFMLWGRLKSNSAGAGPENVRPSLAEGFAPSIYTQTRIDIRSIYLLAFLLSIEFALPELNAAICK